GQLPPRERRRTSRARRIGGHELPVRRPRGGPRGAAREHGRRDGPSRVGREGASRFQGRGRCPGRRRRPHGRRRGHRVRPPGQPPHALIEFQEATNTFLLIGANWGGSPFSFTLDVYSMRAPVLSEVGLELEAARPVSTTEVAPSGAIHLLTSTFTRDDGVL